MSEFRSIGELARKALADAAQRVDREQGSPPWLKELMRTTGDYTPGISVLPEVTEKD